MLWLSSVTYLSPCPCHFLIKSSSQTDGHLVLIAGKPIGEPVVQRGPFVMCTQVAKKNWKIFWTLQRCILIVWSTLYLLRQTLSRRSTTSGAAKMGLRVLWAGDRLRATNKDYQTLVFICIFHGSSSCGCQSCSCWWTPFHRSHILCWHCDQSVVLVGGAWDWSGGTIANKLGTAPSLRSRIGCWVFWVWGVQYWDRTLTSHHPIKLNTYCSF